MVNQQMLMQMLPLLQKNPTAMAQQYGFNIQNQQFNGPKDMVNYFLSSGQTDQNSLNNAVQIARSMGYQI